MRTALLWTLATILAVNGAAMLFAADWWYHTLPNVPPTGPFNAHFVRDIGCAYLVCAASLAWFARDPVRGGAAALMAAVFQLAHAATHLWDAANGRVALEHVLEDGVTVILPALLMLWLAWPRAGAPRTAAA